MQFLSIDKKSSESVVNLPLVALIISAGHTLILTQVSLKLTPDSSCTK